MLNFKEFFNSFPTEESCKQHFKLYREKAGVSCKKCGCKDHYWLSTIEYYKCKKCSFKTSLKSGTVMENSKLPYSYWYTAFMLVTGTKKSFSSLEMQRQIDHKYYEPIWAMMHKIRIVMGKRDNEYKLTEDVEVDEGYFITTPAIEKDQYGNKVVYKKRMKPGKGSPRTSTVLVMAESSPVKFNNKHKSKRAVGYIKMVCIDETKTRTVIPEIVKSIDSNANVLTDGANHYNKLNEVVKSHVAYKMNSVQAHTVLPWVHKTISNSKRILLGIHHSVGRHYTQNYLNEFCYKFNRRHEGDMFERIINVSVNYKWN